MDWDGLRKREFPVAERWAYFDHAAVAPLPRRSGEAIRSWVADQESNGVVHWPNWGRKIEEARANLARLIGAEVSEIAFIPNTTTGIGIVAEGFPWKPGDSVVTAAEEYPSNLYPWMNLADRGVSLRTVPTRDDGRIWVEDLADAIDGSTRLLTISHVEFASGFRNDLDRLSELCRERGVALFVDAIQGLGPLTLDVRRTPIDFLAADGHKWLLGPEGAGVLYLRSDWIERLRPIGVGWKSVVSSYNVAGAKFALRPGAERWEGGSFSMAPLQAFAEGIKMFLEIGPEVVSERILDRAEAVRELARSAGWTIAGSARPEDRSGIVALEHPSVDPDAFALGVRDRGIALACRRGRVRVSPHIYNDADDLGRLAEALASAQTIAGRA
ncbi:aminotransferase class V-fold PLP-dependent enzyme [Tundrisphaera sp. TA3]|uniref:aminotransferase class V-fold PLP-dependent enzyme n=1 Tax=Tundrisphaera sp. TA3 TaxID=3435775 RepID=UPI003EB79314